MRRFGRVMRFHETLFWTANANEEADYGQLMRLRRIPWTFNA
jgi:hypothetical protein